MLFNEKVNILMKPNSITIFCPMKTLDKHIYISVFVQLFVSCLVSYILDSVYTSD